MRLGAWGLAEVEAEAEVLGWRVANRALMVVEIIDIGLLGGLFYSGGDGVAGGGRGRGGGRGGGGGAGLASR